MSISYAGQREWVYLVRAPAREPAPELSWEELREEGMTDVRWWTLDELAATEDRFTPRRLPDLIRDLLVQGPPTEPLDVGL
jgi:hypothetical protein